MGGESSRHAELAGELVEWWEDLWQAHTGSRVVLVAVPPGWGRTTVLDRLAEAAGADDAPVTLIVRIEGQALRALGTAGLRAQALARALQVQLLRADLDEAAEQHRVVERLGLDEPAGRAQLGLGVGNLFFSGLTAGISFLLAGLAVAAAGKAWDDSPAGQDGVLARTARAVGAVSVQAPVTVIIDDADCLDEGLAVTLVENLTARQGSQVLVIAVVDPGSALPAAFRSQVRRGLTSGLVCDAEADPDMGYESRVELARQLCPDLPDAGARRIAQRATTFAEVFTVAAAPVLAEIEPSADEDAVRVLVDAAASGRLTRPAPSLEATVIAWAGGLVHARQADRALGVLGVTRTEGDPDVRRWESLERLADPATPRLADQVATGLTGGQRRDMAAAFLEEALALAADPEADLAGKVAGLRAAHRVRADLPAPARDLPRAQCELVAALEGLGDHAAALQVATEALEGWPAEGEPRAEERTLAAAVIRLSHITEQAPPGPLAEQLIAEAIAGGATAGLEAQIWAAVVLLDTPGQGEAALALAGQATAALETHTRLGAAGDRWRLVLAYHAGRAGLPDLTARLLAPLLNSGDDQREDAARAVLYAWAGPGADTRLQNIVLEAELAVLPPDAGDDRLRIHHALAANHDTLGEYRRALTHGQHELTLRATIQSPDHPDTLTIRQDVASWTGRCGDAAGALRLSRELLPDRERVLGPDHPDTLITRSEIAVWTGECGDAAGALRLCRELLPDRERVLGPGHPDTLTTRNNRAALTGACGDPAGALRLSRELLPDQERVLGPDHPSTLITRNNIAVWTRARGDPAGALRLSRELLPDQERVLGPDHPDTLITRNNIAVWTGECGDPAGALRLSRELLPDLERVLGPDHPYTLTTRNIIAAWTGACGDPAGALRLSRELLPDRERVLGPDHPSTLTTRGAIAAWTGRCGDPAGALRLGREVLPDLERVLGPDHPSTLTTRNNIAAWTRKCRDAAGTIRQDESAT